MNETPKKPKQPGRAWATAGFILGVAVSVAGNVAHTWHPDPAVLAAAGATASNYQPPAGSMAFAAFFPIALLVTVEILARVRWPRGLGWQAAKFLGASIVAAVAAVVSYIHLHGLLLAYGEDGITALIGPLAVDGLMVVAGFAVLAVGRAVAEEITTLTDTAEPAVEIVEVVREVPVTVEVPVPIVTDPFADVDGDEHAAQVLRDEVLSLMTSARKLGLSYDKITAALPPSRYAVGKILKDVPTPGVSPETKRLDTTGDQPADNPPTEADPEPTPTEALNGHALEVARP